MSLPVFFLWLIPALPLVAAAVGALTPRGGRRLAATAAILAMALSFVLSCMALRTALADAAPLYRDAPEAAAAKGEWDSVTDAFMREALPGRPKPVRDIVGDLITTTLSAVGKDFSETPRTPAEIRLYADAMADMFCAYLKSLAR